LTTTTIKPKAPVQVEMNEVLGQNFRDYAISVLLDRAVPDCRDGLKPVQRRVLWALDEDLGSKPNIPWVKSAKVVGACLGNYHPHGDSSVYDASVRLSQPWNLNVPLISGQGNLGSISGDGPAAMRYTEQRISKVAYHLLMADIRQDSVPFVPNFDGSRVEPTVLPARFPNVLVNGASGIAVAYATDIPPCNLIEVCDAAIALLGNAELTDQELAEMLIPDLPTGGVICSRAAAVKAMETGRGSVRVRAKIDHVQLLGKDCLIVTEIPYQTTIEGIMESVVKAVKSEKVKGIRDMRNETGKKGVRLVIELDKYADLGAVENSLYKNTQLESTLTVNLIATVGHYYRSFTAREMVLEWIEFRRATIRRVLTHQVGKILARVHIIDGLLKALADIDAVIKTIKESTDPKASLMKMKFSEPQAEAILEMKLRTLAKLEIGSLREEHDTLKADSAHKTGILRDSGKLDAVIVAELESVKADYPTPRRTEVAEIDTSVTVEDTLADEEFLVVLTNTGFIKRVRHEQGIQKKGGKGLSVGKVRDGDFVKRAFHARTKDHLLVFTDRGRVFDLKAWEIPETVLQNSGKPLSGLVQLKEGETIKTLLNITNDQFEDESAFLMFATTKGLVKKTGMAEYQRILKTGIISLKLRDDDNLLDVVYVNENVENVFMATTWGKGIVFPHTDVRPVGRDTFGMVGIDMDADGGCEACAFEALPGWEGWDVVTIASDGNGKRSPLEEYRPQGRAGTGRIATHLKEGAWLVKAVIAHQGQDLVVTSTQTMIRLQVDGIRELKRDTFGSRLIKLDGKHQVADVTVTERSEE
jgi:DNA gyrase subunit A